MLALLFRNSGEGLALQYANNYGREFLQRTSLFYFISGSSLVKMSFELFHNKFRNLRFATKQHFVPRLPKGSFRAFPLLHLRAEREVEHVRHNQSMTR